MASQLLTDPIQVTAILHPAPEDQDRERHASPAPDDEQLLSLLPASYRTDSDNLAAASLISVFGWLWVAGRPMPPRPLHYQLLLSREILVTEQMDMHLVWTTGRIFLKPVPRFLLEPHFWNRYLCCGQVCRCIEIAGVKGAPKCPPKMAGRCALGFLFSYVALISHESDFLIAKEKHLIPEEVKWSGWRTFVEQLDPKHIYPKIGPRFIYGELRLSRLNKIYILSQRPFLRGYMAHWHQYGSFFQDNFAWLASATVYIAIVLTAMQVGLATNALGKSDIFQSVSYGFTLFSILVPLVAGGFIVMAFCYMFVNNWVVTVAYKQKRLNTIELDP
ncbi:hypothetical protein PENDEC_c030G01277 [Penicillium decumbens]|uniref:Uncharacterized protein n=1 Tax=Penicillium decumbens TaxID=69771 RepID=A0A1V6NWC4_PENDC|nr:hypothetical protein PENDEC_c030G01277 [Penicillium decumbens]